MRHSHIETSAPRICPPRPKWPSTKISHAQYRDWCPVRVEGFGRECAHKQSIGERLAPWISCDYVYISPTGVFARDELSEDKRAGALKVLVANCGATNSLFAHAVPRKRVDQDGYIVEQLKQDALWLGHAKIMIRRDNEPAMLQVVERTLAALRAAGVDSDSEGWAPYDPQTNGAAENAVRLLKGTLRTNLLSLERQIRARIPLDHPILAWLVSHSANIRTMRVKGPDGRTAHQRARGAASSVRLLPFGEICRYKCRSQEKSIGAGAWRWSIRIWLDVQRRTGQYMVYDRSMGGVRYART